MQIRNKASTLILAFSVSACASTGAAGRNALWVSTLNALTVSYESAGRACVANSATKEDAVACLVKVRDAYEPAFTAVEAASDIDNAIVALCAATRFKGIEQPKELKELCKP